VNGDGYDDVSVGDPYFSVGEWDDRGAAFVFHGRSCGNGVDDHGDGRTDYPSDPGCTSLADASEIGAACDNNVDDDGDGGVDYPADLGCRNLSSLAENPQCQDGANNDGQPGIDFDGGASVNGGVPIDAADPECNQPWGDREAMKPVHLHRGVGL
jgi:hypothetical protein